MQFPKIPPYRTVRFENDRTVMFAPAAETNPAIVDRLNQVGLWRYVSLENTQIGAFTVWHEVRATPYTQAVHDMQIAVENGILSMTEYEQGFNMILNGTFDGSNYADAFLPDQKD